MQLKSKSGQVTIFVIVALVLVGLIALFFVFKDSLFGQRIDAEFAPIYSLYEQCISQETINGIRLLSSQGGRIDSGDFTAGNDFNPFSTHLSFLGLSIPYWYGLSGNNQVIENVPTMSDMSSDIEEFISQRLNDCDFSTYRNQGFYIETSEPDVVVTIEDSSVLVSVDAPLTVYKEDKSARRSEHEVLVDSQLGKLYSSAIAIYQSEQDSLFLENYALDVMQSYAPVDGVEVQCSPKIWKTPEVVDNLKSALATNIGAVRFSGAFSRSDDKIDNYFTVDTSIDSPVSLIYLPEQFPSKIEVTPASQALMIAEPVGTQEGLGVMGFCYVPYHFVYDVSFPVLIVVGDGLETFQFPVVVVIDNNLARVAPTTEFSQDEATADVCNFAEGEVNVKTYDAALNPISANISFSCFDSVCSLGQTSVSGESATLDAKIPLCVNGKITATASGYAPSEISYSSNREVSAELILDKEYAVNVNLLLAGQSVKNVTSIVHFTGDNGYSVSAVLSEDSMVNLKEGLYDISVYVYGDSNVIIPATRKTECFTATRGGIAGLFGSTKEECVDVEIPSVKIDYALRGGGKTTSYILETELAQGDVVVEVSELPRPTTLEQLQYNYEVFDTLGVQLEFS
ncbi:MAG: hypothetical protein ACP5NS_01985 [Candidatus Pacearchaeota archaeon]